MAAAAMRTTARATGARTGNAVATAEAVRHRLPQPAVAVIPVQAQRMQKQVNGALAQLRHAAPLQRAEGRDQRIADQHHGGEGVVLRRRRQRRQRQWVFLR